MELYVCDGIRARSQAYGLLAFALAQHGITPPPRLERTKLGKPYFPDLPQLHFSLSHSGPLALCALDRSPVGADVEILRPHHPRLPQRICSPEQLEWLLSQPDQARALCRLWTMKECLVKYRGTGLTVPIRSICVPLPPPMDGTLHDGLIFTCLDGPDWSAALCGHSLPGSPIRTAPEQLPELSHPDFDCWRTVPKEKME